MKRQRAPAAWLAAIQGRCASASPRMRHGAASFRIPSGAFASSNPRRNCNFILRRVWTNWKPQDLAVWTQGSSISCRKPIRN